MSNLAVSSRALLVVAATLALGCSTKSFNTRAIGVVSDGGSDTRGRGPTISEPDGGVQEPDNTPKCPAEAPPELKTAGQTCLCGIECATGTCEAGVCCAAGACATLRPLGAVCEEAAECQSGFCADGVCCNVGCTGACVSCDQVDQMGICSPVPAGSEDKHGVCRMDAPDTCGQSGYCNGQGGCAKYVAGTICKLSTCSGKSEFVPASLCDGEGACEVGLAISCFPSTCESGACLNSCTSNDNCMAPNSCVNGSCGPKGNGQDCTQGSQCQSGFCVDGVCCESACTGKCTFCASPEGRGRCLPVKANVLDQRAARGETDPAKICVAQEPSTCGTDGRCDGKAGCQRYRDGTICRAARCDTAANTETPASVCDDGTCRSATARGCGPYRGCTGNACRNSCGSDAQCSGGNFCTAGDCGKKPDGAVCTSNGQCTSNVCAQGRCCAGPCTGTCKSCALPGREGQCTNVQVGGADPTGSCRDDACSNGCDGNGGCRRERSDGTVTCGGATCQGTSRVIRVCGAGGGCESRTVDCGVGSTCMGGSCVANPKANGQPCVAAAECASRLCINNVCCAGACGGACKECQAGTGNCVNKGGGCGNGGTCMGGVCCGPGTTNCGGVCRNLESDEANCGRCGGACAQGQTCVDRACTLICGAPEKACGNQCIDVTSDVRNCGDCNRPCPANSTCNRGTCTCAGPMCGTACCPAGQVCSANKCCPAGQTSCGGTCRNLASDGANCGMCGRTCGACERCMGSACRPDPSKNGDDCDGASGNNVCDNGACVSTCATVMCAGVCCPAGQVCRNGACNDPLPTCNPTTCAAMGPCRECKADGTCGFKNANSPCDDDRACTTNDRCNGTGTCAGTVTCTSPPDACHNSPGACGGNGACAYSEKADGATCGAGQICCNGGCCQAGKVCRNNACSDPLPTCNAAACAAMGPCRECKDDGTCGFKAAESACDDGRACTANDRCNGTGTCAGTVACTSPPDGCHSSPGTCGGNGACTYPEKGDGAACGQSQICCNGGCCQAGQVCRNNGCNDPLPVCNAAACAAMGPCRECKDDGTCGFKSPTTECDDERSCTANDRCNAVGVCAGTVACTSPPDDCHNAAGSCGGNGACTYSEKADGAACGNGQVCCNGGCCQAGQVCRNNGCNDPLPVCNAAACAAMGPCRECKPDGSCGFKNENATCDDERSCTTNDRCNGSGTCAGTVSCTSPPSACHDSPGRCGDNGACTYTAKDNGDSCGGNRICCSATCCEAGNLCQNNACSDPPPMCNEAACAAMGPCRECKPDGSCGFKAGGATCDDRKACTANDRCSEGGVCAGTETCTDPPNDQCFEPRGQCAPNGSCRYDEKADGTGCGEMRQCQNGSCQGVCTDAACGACKKCNPARTACVDDDGAPCGMGGMCMGGGAG